MSLTTRRAYNSPARQGRAQETRRRILEAARSLFARQGYEATTIEQVAAGAGVAVQTIYQAFRTKTGLLAAQLDAIDEIGGVAELQAAIADPAASPAGQARALARFMRRIVAGAGDLLDAARSAGRTDLEFRRMFEAGMERHRQGVAGMVRGWAARGALRAGLEPEAAAAMVAVASDPTVVETLRRDWSWSETRCEAWIAESIERLVLDPAFWETGGTPPAR